MNIFDKFKLGLSKSSKNFSSGLNNLIFKKKIDDKNIYELEDFLIESDVGVESAKELCEKFSKIFFLNSLAASTPTSHWIKKSSNSFNKSVSIFFLKIKLFKPEDRFFELLPKPNLNLSKIPIITLF